MKKLLKDLYNYKIIIIVLIIYILFMQLKFGEICIIKVLFNKNCPGCGLTRAFIYLLKGDFNKSIETNFTLIFWIVFIILFVTDRYIKKLNFRIVPSALIILCVITFIRYLIVELPQFTDIFI